MDDDEFVVRSADETDASAIAHVHLRSWQQSYRGMIPDDALDRLDVDQWEAHHRDRLHAPEPHVATYVAEHGDQILGLAICGHGRHIGYGSQAELAALYVDPAHHRLGIGTMLADTVLDDMDYLAFESVYLWVLEANAGSQRFYRRMGFAPTGERQTFTVHGYEIPEVCWARELPEPG